MELVTKVQKQFQNHLNLIILLILLIYVIYIKYYIIIFIVGNQINVEGVKAIAESLKFNNSIHSIDLGDLY